MRGDNFRPTLLCKHFKKWNSECGDKLSKLISFLPPLPIEATGTKSLPANKNVLLSSIESRVDNLKVELGINKVCDTSDKGTLVLQQFLAEIKDQDKEHLLTGQSDESSTDALISSCRCDYANALRAKCQR